VHNVGEKLAESEALKLEVKWSAINARAPSR